MNEAVICCGTDTCPNLNQMICTVPLSPTETDEFAVSYGHKTEDKSFCCPECHHQGYLAEIFSD